MQRSIYLSSSAMIGTSLLSAGLIPVAGAIRRNDVAAWLAVVFFSTLLAGIILLAIYLTIVRR